MKANGNGKQADNLAVCYIRVSTEEQALEGVSLAAQEAKLRAYCELAGLQIVALVRDEGVSGAKPLATRPGGEQVVKLVSQRKAGNIVAMKLDRLFRDAADCLAQTKTWDGADVALHLVDVGGQSVNTKSAMGRFFLTMMGGVAELERNLIAERTATALNYKKGQRQAYGPTPFGYDREGERLTVNAEEMKVARKVIAWRDRGLSFGHIVAILERGKVRTKGGKQWHRSTVKYIADNRNLYE